MANDVTKNEVTPIFEIGKEMGLYTREKGKNWPLQTKILVTMMMHGTVRQYGEDEQGLPKEVPEFSNIESMTGIPKKTLSLWWDKRDELMEQRNQLFSVSENYINMHMISVTHKIMNEIMQRDLSDVSTEKLYDMIGKAIKYSRITGNRPTETKEVRHVVQPALPEGAE